MFLRNHGAVICGKDIEEAFGLLLDFMEACSAQVLINLVLLFLSL